MIDIDDIVIWADGTMCFGDELAGHLSFMSDDYRVVIFDSREWKSLVNGT